MKSTSKTFSRNGMTESLDTVVVKELEFNQGKIVVFSCVSTAEQLNFAEFANCLRRVARFAFWRWRILQHDWTGIFIYISIETH